MSTFLELSDKTHFFYGIVLLPKSGRIIQHHFHRVLSHDVAPVLLAVKIWDEV